jgi:hypothetical protein
MASRPRPRHAGDRGSHAASLARGDRTDSLHLIFAAIAAQNMAMAGSRPAAEAGHPFLRRTVACAAAPRLDRFAIFVWLCFRRLTAIVAGVLRHLSPTTGRRCADSHFSDGGSSWAAGFLPCPGPGLVRALGLPAMAFLAFLSGSRCATRRPSAGRRRPIS